MAVVPLAHPEERAADGQLLAGVGAHGGHGPAVVLSGPLVHVERVSALGNFELRLEVTVFNSY